MMTPVMKAASAGRSCATRPYSLCAVIVADQRTHTLHNAVGREIEEGLQLVVNAENDHIALGIAAPAGRSGRRYQQEGSARFRTAGMPMAYRRPVHLAGAEKCLRRRRTGIGRRQIYDADTMTSVSIWPMPVARAAPAMPIAGKGPEAENQQRGPARCWRRQPHIRLAMVTFIRPTAWKIFSKASAAAMITGRRRKTME